MKENFEMSSIGDTEKGLCESCFIDTAPQSRPPAHLWGAIRDTAAVLRQSCRCFAYVSDPGLTISAERDNAISCTFTVHLADRCRGGARVGCIEPNCRYVAAQVMRWRR